MAGIYLHIPFCRQACHYCDFHFSTVLKNKDELLYAMHKEIDMRKGYVQEEKIKTIYFGGGTPSLLEGDELKLLIENLHQNFEIDTAAEITLEANPDDLTKRKIDELYDAGVNRLSIGIQSFRDVDLKLMNRAHNASQADYAVKASQDKGFDNITIDLIYSIPGLSLSEWQENLQKAMELNVQHISAYSLTIEANTVFGAQEKKGALHQVDQELTSVQFLTMISVLSNSNFEQYEVSNFCLPGFESKHNSAYWKGAKYLGIGPSAHSFDGNSRQWNVSNNALYTRSLEKGELNFEREVLDDRTRLNEYLMTGLRTKWGVDTTRILKEFSFDLKMEYKDMIEEWKHKGFMNERESHLILSPTGLLMADRIASELFMPM